MSLSAAPIQSQEITCPPGVYASAGSRYVLYAFVISLFIPIQLFLGDLKLTPYRFILIAAFAPAAITFLMSPTLKIQLPDVLMGMFALVGGFSLMKTGSGIPTFGIFIVDSLGPYLLARTYIRNVETMIGVARVLVFCIIATIPFAFLEAVSSRPVILDALSPIFNVLPNVPHEVRLGLDRAQVVFDHPILYGVFCSLGFSFAILICGMGQSLRWNWVKGGLVGFAAFLSLSSGAFLAVGLQVCLLGYDVVMRWLKSRWLVLLLSLSSLLVVLELLSNRSLAQISIGFLALNPGTAWTRLAVNDAALDELSRNMWFGLGMEPVWYPPPWIVTTSIDNFYIAVAFRHGIPTIALLLLAIFVMVWSVIRVNLRDPRAARCRKAILITLGAVMVAMVTVHLWNTTYVGFIFILGSIMWLIEEGRRDKQKPPCEPIEMKP
ncbi:MAG: O-antigen ligase family protein [Pseudomonadota bacterium]